MKYSLTARKDGQFFGALRKGKRTISVEGSNPSPETIMTPIPQMTPATYKGLSHLGVGEIDFLAQTPTGKFEHYRIVGVRSFGFGKCEREIKNVATGAKRWMTTDHLVTKKYDGPNKYNPHKKNS
jgi:hypothetical protein